MFGLSPFSATPFSSTSGGIDVTVAVTGVQATGEIGTVNQQSKYYVTGVSATAELGEESVKVAVDVNAPVLTES